MLMRASLDGSGAASGWIVRDTVNLAGYTVNDTPFSECQFGQGERSANAAIQFWLMRHLVCFELASPRQVYWV